MTRLFLTALREAVGAVPQLGIIGAAAVREAFEGDLRDLQTLLQAAVREKLNVPKDKDWMPYVQGLFEDFIVVEDPADGKLVRFAYKVTGDTVTLGEAEEVRKTFEPVAGAKVTEAADDADIVGAFLEAEQKGGGAWRIRVVSAGLSANRNFYSDDLLRESAPMFDGVRVFVKSDEEHLAGKGKSVHNLIGSLSDIVFVEGKAPDSGEIQAKLTLIEPEGAVAVKIREAWDRKLTSLFGFSIDATALATKVTRKGIEIREAKQFKKIKSVDLIVEPGAGGGVIDLIEATKDTIMDRTQIIALLEAKGLLKGKKVDELSDEQLTEILREAVGTANDDDSDTTTMREAVRMVEARATMRVSINASSLPAKAKARLIAKFEGEESFTEAAVTQAIKDEAEYLGEFTESGTVTGLGENMTIEMGETRHQKVVRMLDAFFDPAHKDHRHVRSFKEAYIDITGDRQITGNIRNCDPVRLREALESSTFDDVLGNSITRRMLADYRVNSTYDVWRLLANVVPVNDFRTQERTRIGGYGNLPGVNQKAPYMPLTSPSDEKATYAVTKRGGTEELTLEMITNDDVGVIRRIPINLSRAAKRTLGQFVLDFLRTNPAIYDSVALFHADHGNLGSTALGSASLAAARLAMLQQTEKDSGDRLGIPARNLWVPTNLEETAVDLFRRNTNNDQTFINSLTLNVIPVWYWTDANDWVVTADKDDAPMIEIGFLHGNEEPELFIQDSPTSGAMFSHDTLTYKIRHIYGGNATDYRPGYKAVVA